MSVTKHARASRSLYLIAGLGCVAFGSGSGSADTLPTDFSIVPILQGGISKPISVCFLPAQLPTGDQRLFMLLAEQDGRVLFQQYAGQAPSQVLQLTNIGAGIGELGLLGIVADPGFDINNPNGASNFVYVSYTEAAPSGFDCDPECSNCYRSHISRFRMDLTPPLMHSEEVVWVGEWFPACGSQAYHWAGDLHFVGNDSLYVSTGDHFDVGQAQNPQSELGKMLRIDRENFGIGPAQIWSSGLRNPFRFNTDAQSPGALYIGNVGSNGDCNAVLWEELNVAPASGPTLNFGWPCSEGPLEGCPCTGFATVPECVNAQCANFTLPFWTYDHSVGNSIIGGPVYRGTRYPPQYQGNAYVGDYIQGWIKRIPINGLPATAVDFLAPDVLSDIVDLEIGPLDSLYVVKYASNNSYAAGVYRIGYREPAASFRYRQLSPSGDPDDRRVVLFNGSVKYNLVDFPNATVTYAWDFGDGATSSLQNPQHTYAERREYVVRLTAQIQSPGQPVWMVPAASVEIATGLRPTIQIGAPGAGTIYYVNCPTPYSASAIDGLGNPVSTYHWRVEWVHDEHVHLINNLPDGPSGVFVAPSAPPTGHTEPLPFRMVVEAVDSRGISSEAPSPNVNYSESHSITLNARPAETDFSVQLGTQNLILTTPSIVSDAPGTPLTVTAPSQISSGGTTYTFRCWSDNGDTNPIRAGALASGNVAWTAHYTIATVSTCTIADTDGDGCIQLSELSQVLAAYGTMCCANGNPEQYQPDCDFDGDCSIGLTELATVLSQFGQCP